MTGLTLPWGSPPPPLLSCRSRGLPGSGRFGAQEAQGAWLSGESHLVGEWEAAWSSEGLPSQWSARDTGMRAAPTWQTPTGGAGSLPAENVL